MTNQEIKDTGLLIKNEQQIGGNTALRVGGVIEGIGYALDNKDAANGYYQATINGGSISVNAPNYLLGSGGNLRLKMPAAGTTASTLTIGNANAVQLWYNGAAVSSDNTWEQGEIISVFYDGTKYMASNSQGGGGAADKISYDNSQSGIAANDVQGALDEQGQEISNLVERLTKTETSTIAFRGTTNYNSHDLALPKGKLTIQIIVPEGDTAVQPAGATAGFEIQIPVGTQKLKLTQKQFAQLTLPQTYTYKYESDGSAYLRIYERVRGNCMVVVSGIEEIDASTISYANTMTSADNVNEALNDIYSKVSEIPSSLTKREYVGNKIDIKKHKYSAQQYADITAFDTAHAVQGGCNWGKYLFIGISGGTTYYVIDLEAKASLGSFTVPTPSITDTHCNTMNFSNKYWQEGDEFPIMYASSGYGIGSNPTTFCAYGYRIVRNENVFSATLVHTINITKSNCTWTEFVVDNDNNRAWIKCEVGGNIEWYSLAMPNPSNGDTTINLDEIEKAFTLPFNYIGSAQNHLFYNGRIFFTSDTGNTGAQHYIYVVNPYSGGYDSIVNISTIYDRETEQLFIYNNNIYVRYRTGQYTRNVYYKYYFE